MTRRESFEDFITKNLDSAYRYAYTYAKNKQDAEDILNESILKAWKAIDKLREAQYIKTWFYKIISNTAITYLKKQGSLVATEDVDLERLDFVEDKYQEDSFESMIRTLPPMYKEVIVLRFFEEMSLCEIASVLDINENTVKTRLYRGLRALKVDMERDGKWIS